MCALKCPLVVLHFIFIIDKTNRIGITDRLSFINNDLDEKFDNSAKEEPRYSCSA